MTGNVRDNCYPHIRLLPTHPHLASTDFIRLLPVATSAHLLITNSQCYQQICTDKKSMAKSHGHLLVNLAVIIPYCTFHESLLSEVSFEFRTH